eukprot:GAFH01000841.1.p1 GENE.GAFH01000841.1~~GAFH01000841.1.p1  ORF type:complete len:838 (+),score=323.79 GAFH01000841.1:56-2569(+)
MSEQRTQFRLGTRSHRPLTIDERRQLMNEMFGFKKTRHILRRRRLDERSEKVRSLHEPVSGIRANANPERFITIGNVLYLAFFGWWLALAHLILGGLLALTVVGMDHARICFSLADYLWWPFGKYIERGTHLRSAGFTTLELQSLMKTRNLSPRLKVASVLWWVLFAPLSCLFSGLAALISWMMIFYIPTSKVLWEVIKLMWRQPLHLHIGNGNPPIDSEVLVCTYSAVNLYYYKLTVSGINIVIFNMLPIVAFTIILGYSAPTASPVLIFVLSLISIMPLASIIGMAISSISAQTNFAVGALLNATFGSIIELILYVDAFRYGHTDLILQGISGGLFCNLLFLPGMAMVFGGIKYKEQRFNSLTAGVSSMMLIIATVGMFFPTVFYTLRGSTTLQCTNCTMAEGKLDCSGGCLTDRLADLMQDPIYRKAGQPLEFAVAGILLLAYIVGMVFTLKTHAYMYSLDPRHLAEEADEAAEGGNAGGGEEDEAQGGPAGAEEALLAEEHERDAASHQRGRSSAHQQGAPFLSLLEPANVGDATNTSDLEPVPVAVTHPSVTTAPALSEPTLAQLVPASLAPAATTTSTSYQSDPLSLSLGTDPALDRPLSAAMAGLTPAASPSKEPILPGSRQFSLEGLGSAPAMPATGTAALVSSGGAAAQQQQMAQSGRPKKKKAEASHEDAPEWSKLKCVIVLACGVGSFAVIAEKMTGVLEPALKAVGVSESFAGITLIGLIPSMAEIINAIQFGLHDHISLSLEIGMSSAVQIAMVEVPFVIFMGAFAGQRDLAAIWPDLDMFGVFISVLIITYMSIDGRSNYFEGSALVLLYMTLVAAYFFWNQV